jgi:hypothetical protein
MFDDDGREIDSDVRNEWELLVIAEDIEPGDYLEVEGENSDTEYLMLVKESRHALILRDADGELVNFSPITLEEINGYRHILCKANRDD